MALVTSTMMPLGTKAPDFKLKDSLTNKTLSLQQLRSQKATVILFICNHCPYVIHILDKLIEVTEKYLAKGVAFIAISSNDAEAYPDDAFDKMAQLAKKRQFSFPYLYDKTQSVAKEYQAACTPDFYIFDKDLLCVYRGQFDDSRPGNETPITGKDIQTALDNVLLGKPVPTPQLPSVGCSIKWK